MACNGRMEFPAINQAWDLFDGTCIQSTKPCSKLTSAGWNNRPPCGKVSSLRKKPKYAYSSKCVDGSACWLPYLAMKVGKSMLCVWSRSCKTSCGDFFWCLLFALPGSAATLYMASEMIKSFKSNSCQCTRNGEWSKQPTLGNCQGGNGRTSIGAWIRTATANHLALTIPIQLETSTVRCHWIL